MKINIEIADLSNEIMLDITDDRLILHNIILKASRLALLTDIPASYDLSPFFNPVLKLDSRIIKLTRKDQNNV
jgi:hypothetical protein